MATICFNVFYKHAFEAFTCVQKEFFRYFILFLLNCSLKRANIWMGSCICFVF